MKKECKKCGQKKRIVNKFFGLCYYCNKNRLKQTKPPTTKKNFNYGFVKNFVSTKKTTKQKIKEDEEFYEKCFNASNHKCEECGKQLNTEFRDINGKVINKSRYSHIIPKSISEELRHSINNINHLCLLHHIQWENGDYKNMNIYKTNKKRFPNYFL